MLDKSRETENKVGKNFQEECQKTIQEPVQKVLGNENNNR